MQGSKLQDALLRLWQSGYRIEFPVMGIVKSVNQSQQTVNIASGDEKLENVRYYVPVKPAIGSKCLVVFRNNVHDRAVALAFEKLVEIDTTIAEKVRILIDQDGLIAKYNELNSIELKEASIDFNYSDVHKIILDADGISIEAPITATIKLGQGAQKLALGETLKAWLEALIGIITATPLVTDPQSSAPLPATPALIAALNAHKATLASILSQHVKTS